ncbi:hypothetical protein OESDEN_03841 [Oesophagostomum dentatum]|uniref:Uncharacterized protein n=1 Tax=Oesophagostomum dentatum TaxID=61180 RepID=A0A0B1TK75_OESDE|nr:hypothetical protein OESDEN_03841 [Oesophagostomum dentatum]
MLAPIITKDMKLFPTRPLPAGIKNVRSRAQSLDQFSQVQNSGSARGRIVPVKPRSSQSTGNLPAVAASASFSRSPPKASVHRKTTLTAIQEGVEMSHSHVPDSRHMESRSDSKLPTDATRRSTRRPKKGDKENETTKNGHCMSVESTSASDSAMEKKEKKGVVRWLTSAFRKSREKDSSDTSSSNSS